MNRRIQTVPMFIGKNRISKLREWYFRCAQQSCEILDAD